MRLQTLEHLKKLQHQSSQIRNICILAHVDHGKTTIADALVASNGIISKRNAGKIRYMDSRVDEQERGITMKSSAITLVFEKCTQGDESRVQQYLINLIDSPGHVDFSSEVTTAVRLCDGAVVVVDVVEGVCPQTHAVLKQAWLEEIRPILILNKLDRLISQLKMTPMEAYYHIIQILEQVNLITNQLFVSDAMEKTSMNTITEDNTQTQNGETNSYDWTVIEDEEEPKNIYFSPELGNVVFASAIDGWGFTMGDFVHTYATKLGVKEQVLQKTLWGDYYINMKAKRFLKGAQSKGKKPLFVQFVLENIWAAYDAVLEQRDSAMTDKIVKSLGVTVTPRDVNHKDPRVLLQSIMGQWLPLSNAILATVVQHIPSPVGMSEERVEELMCSQNRKFSSLPEATQLLKKDFQACSSSIEAPVIIFVSKMFPVERKCLPQNKARPLTEEELQLRREDARRKHAEIVAKRESSAAAVSASENKISEPDQPNGFTYLEDSSNKSDEEKEDHVFIAFARIFSGTICKGSKILFLGPKHDPGESLNELSSLELKELMSQPDILSKHPHISVVKVKELFLLMGRELEALDEVPAGNVFGIGGLEGHILKSGTLASTLACPAFTDMYFDAAPIVRVAVEPANASDISRLVAGLRLLNQADPCVEVRVQETGEHVIIAAGEVHLQRCIDDLKERYAKVEVNVSKPIVPFRETVIRHPKLDMVNENILEQQQKEEEEEDRRVIQVSTADRQCHLLLRASPLPGNVAEILIQHQKNLKALDSLTTVDFTGRCNLEIEFCLTDNAIETLRSVRQQLKEEFDKAGEEWAGAEDRIWSFGPRRCGPNILLNCIKGYNRPPIWHPIISGNYETGKLVELDNSIVTGFQMATLAGPLCEEPMHGVCFVVENWWYGERMKPSDSQDTESTFIPTKDIAKPAGSETAFKESIENLSADSKTQVSVADNPILNETVSESIPDCSTKESILDDPKENLSDAGAEAIQRLKSSYGPLSGQLISSMKDGCRRTFQAQPQRLMAALYRCEIQATVEVLGKLHAVLAKRCGQVLSEEMQEGTATFVINAVLPVVESFGFAEELRKKTSGLASPQLQFSHWEVLPVDPFWVPTTEEEYLHFGEKADAQNKAKTYMNQVRKRKGLPTDEKIVEFAEKQRTLTKNK